MFKLQSKGVISGAVAAACLAVPAIAQERTALVIANSAYAGDDALPDVRAAALKVSETLLGLGFAVNRLENPSSADLQTAVSTAQAGDGVSLIYYAGRTDVEDNISMLVPVANDGGVPIEPLVSGPSDSTRFVFLDVCHDLVEAEIAEDDGPDDDDFLEGEGDDPDEDLPLATSLVASIDAAENLFFGASVEPGEECQFTAGETLTDVLLDSMTVPGLAADQFIPAVQAETDEAEANEDAIWFGTTLDDPFIFRTATSDVRLTAEDYAMLDQLSPEARDQMLRLWASAGIAVDIAGAQAVTSTPIAPVATTNSTVVLVAPVRPVASATIISPISPRATTGAGTSIQPVTSGVTLVAGGGAAPAPAVFRATPGENGLPAPSILVGFATDGDEIVVPEVDEGPVAGAGLSYDDLEARNAMREQDAELFAGLVESGAFDPPEAEMARAIQTELARMNCYRSGIDGIWGPGSRRSVTAYYDEVGGSTPSQDPVAEIFRQIIVSEDVRCPDPPAPAPRAAAAPRRATTTQAAPRRAATQAAPAAPAPAAPAAPARRTISQSAGTGAFR